MQKYFNLVQDSAGNALSGVTVTVYDTGTSTVSTLYSSNTGSAQANPFTNDSDGSFEFYAANGRYDVVYTKTGYTFTAANSTDIVLFDADETTFRLTADGSAITTIANFFGATSNIVLVANAHYDIEMHLFFLKTTSDTVVITLTNNVAPTKQNVTWEKSPNTGIVAPPGTATALFGQIHGDATAALAITTGSLTTAVNHYIKIRMRLENSTGTSLKIQATATSGSVTPLRGSFWTAKRIPATNNGTYAA